MNDPAADPLSFAAEKLFGLSYLFPYQRLVIANILEAASARGIKLHWPGKAESSFRGAFETGGGDGIPNRGTFSGAEEAPVTDDERADEPETDDFEPDGFSDRESLGRQIVILPTGAGKSLCFQLPAMLMDGPTLVIYPLLGLMADQERRLTEHGFTPLVLRGGQTKEERERAWEKIRSGAARFVISNPETLLTPSVLTRLRELNILHIVIDEAHSVSEWGESFRPAYLEINKIIEAAAPPLITAFTATAGASVLEKIERYIFGSAGAHRITGNPDRKNISYAARGCILRNLAARDLVLANQRPAIVFCSSRPGTERLAAYLRNEMRERNVPWQREIRFYHAGLSREEKTETEKWFLRNEEAVLVATCAYGLGMDKPDIRTVIHRDAPPSVEAYLQESGRAGRDGELSRAVLLWGPDDEKSLARVAAAGERERAGKLLSYARDTSRCRREALLELLGYEGEMDSPEPPCCDVCEKEARPELREELNLRDFFRRNKRCYTQGEAAVVLARAENIKWEENDAKDAIRYLLNAGKLKKLKNPLWKDKIIPAGKG